MQKFELPPITPEVYSAGIIQQAAEREHMAACIMRNDKLIEAARNKCHAALDAYLDAYKDWIDNAMRNMNPSNDSSHGG
jgi:hypothetical protein